MPELPFSASDRQADPRSRWPSRTLVELSLLTVLLAVSLAVRLYDLEGPRSSAPDLFDEGLETQQLLLMANGFQPYRDIYNSLGTLKLHLLYPFFALFGGTLGSARLGVGLLSMLGLVGAWWSGRVAAGPAGGLAASFLLSVSPAYLEHSRLAIAEVPSLVPCIWAIGCALRWYGGGRDRWIFGAVVLGTVGVLIKPMALSIAAPVAVLLLIRPGLRLRTVFLCIGIALGITILSVLALGASDVYEQVIGYRLGAREGSTWELRRNFRQVLAQPFKDQPGLFVLAPIAGGLLMAAKWRAGLALISWPLVTIAMLLTYSPLHPKHLAYLFPPLTFLSGVGIGRAISFALQAHSARRVSLLAAIGAAALFAVLPLGLLRGALDGSREVAEPDDADLHSFDRAVVQSVSVLTGPRDFMLTDHAYLALLSNRMVPPKLADLSFGRIRAGVLTDQDVFDAAEQFDVRLVLTWSDRMRRLPGVPPWLDQNYQLSQVFGHRSVKIPRGAKDRSIYLPRTSDLAAARTALEGNLAVRETADFDQQLRLLGATIPETPIAPGEQFTVTVGWLALAPMPSDYHVTVELIAADGRSYDAQEDDLDGGALGTSTWPPGRWLFRTSAIQPENGAPPGEYRVQLAILDPKSNTALRPTISPGAATFREDPERAVSVGVIVIR